MHKSVEIYSQSEKVERLSPEFIEMKLEEKLASACTEIFLGGVKAYDRFENAVFNTMVEPDAKLLCNAIKHLLVTFGREMQAR